MKFRKKAIVIEATQWFKNGDHPDDHSAESEGKVVRYYRNPNGDSEKECNYCHQTMHYHGWIDTLEGGHIVCPSDWIITGAAGEYYPYKDNIFKATYEPVE
jgi:hypothetical protein